MRFPSVVRLPRPLAAFLAVLVSLAAVPALLGVGGPQPGQRVDMKVLLISPSATDSGFQSWKGVLAQEGVPYEPHVVGTSPALTDAALADYDAGHARYQAVIVTAGNITDEGNVLPAAEVAALVRFESTFGIRRISDNTWPSPDRGLDWGGAGGPLDGTSATLTGAGRAVFPELKGIVPIDDIDPAVSETYGWPAHPLPNSPYVSLLDGSAGSYLGVVTHPDGREEMVVPLSSNRFQLHNQLLRRGMINWVTRGVHLGSSRNHFAAHIDDVFLPDAKWDPVQNCTPGDDDPQTCTGPQTDIRMTPTDTAATRAWQGAHRIRFDMVYNGQGYRVGDPNTPDPLGDDPADGLLVAGVRDEFRWINHTWSHPQLDLTPLGTPTPAGTPLPWPEQGTLLSEIGQNIQFAQQHGLAIDPKELVTGEHSGLGSYYGHPLFPNANPVNPNLATALGQTGIRWFGDDNSVQPQQRMIGTATSVPRHPSNIYYNVASREDQLDEYNHIYLPPALGGKCIASAVTTCRTAPATWDDYVTSEKRIMFQHMMDNDPRPHYMHQANLIVSSPGQNGNGIMFGSDGQGVLDHLFADYSTYIDTLAAPIVNPTMTQAGEAIRDQDAWRQASGGVTAYIQNGAVHITTTAALAVPITGTTTVGDVYADHRSGWTTVNGTATFPIDAPTATTAPTVAGDAYAGRTLTATAGTWAGAPTVNGAWLRCDVNGAACVPIQGNGAQVTGTTYTLTPADRGATVRYAEGPVGSLAESRSDPTPIVREVKMLTPPVVTDTPRVGVEVTATAATWQDAGAPVQGPTHQWMRCDGSGLACEQITGATGSSYVPVPADLGATLKVVESLTLPWAETLSTESAVTAAVAAPEATVAPSIAGDAYVGRVLTATRATWRGSPDVTFAWLRCDGAGANCAVIAGTAGAVTYTPTPADRGHTLAFVEHATGTTVESRSPATAVVREVKATQPPNLLPGTPQVGVEVTATAAAWQDAGAPIAPSSRQWWRCPATGSCEPITDATGLTYMPVAADLGATLKVVETLTLPWGATLTSDSEQSDPVVAPVGTRPVVHGDTYVGRELTVMRARWEGSPAVAFEWQSCDGNAGCGVIPGTSGLETYTPTPADRGRTLVFVEHAVGTGVTIASLPTAPVREVKVVTTPKITGTPRVGVTLNVSSEWQDAGAPVQGPTHQWMRCDGSGLACEQITGATGLTYTPVAADLGATLKVVDTVTLPWGETLTSESPVTAVVTAAPVSPDPAVTPPPSSAGTDVPASPPAPPATGGGVQPPPTTPSAAVVPRITSLRLTPGRFVPATRPAHANDPRRRTVARWGMTAPARITVVMQRRVGKRWVTLKAWRHEATGGVNSLRYLGWLKGRPMAAGPGRMVMWTTGDDGRRTSTAMHGFIALRR